MYADKRTDFFFLIFGGRGQNQFKKKTLRLGNSVASQFISQFHWLGLINVIFIR